MPKPSKKLPPIYERPVELLQQLIRFDTTNPPGNEGACIAYINGLMKDAGLKRPWSERPKRAPTWSPG
jgi:acetylornithine deacetylase/succinyl-diaminopimelate desuccinylase-like protein